MKRIFQKIEWKTRRWEFELDILNIYFPSEMRLWGIELIKINYHNREFSLLKLQWMFPNVAERTEFLFFWDLLFLYDYLNNRAIEKAENEIWKSKD